MAVVLVDYYGNPIRSFKTWREANKFRIIFIYLIGVVVTLFLFYMIEKNDYRRLKTYTFSLGTLVLYLLFSLLSWMAVIIVGGVIIGDTIIIRKS